MEKLEKLFSRLDNLKSLLTNCTNDSQEKQVREKIAIVNQYFNNTYLIIKE
mgnify:CR=1 FL=1